MIKFLLFKVCLLLDFFFVQCMFSDGSYKAAVVEFSPSVQPYPQEYDILQYNAEEYGKIIEKVASEGVQIVVFPEDGITSTSISHKNVMQLGSYGIDVPNLFHQPNPCNNESLNKILRIISCAAKRNGIYVVISILEKQKDSGRNTFYKSVLVFDRSGTIITKYRKRNFLRDTQIYKGSEVATFQTDFNVTFGIISSEDIYFKNVAIDVLKEKGVTDIVYSSVWYTETPFLQALSLQAGYSRAAGVNLLAASLNDPKNGNGGSGIYLFDGKIAELYISPSEATKVLMRDVPKIHVKLSAVKCNNNTQIMPRFRLGGNLNVGTFTTRNENMTGYTMVPLDGLETRRTLCNFNGVYCCDFHVVLKERTTSLDPNYRLVMFYGVRQIENRTVGVRTCALVACLNADDSMCGVIQNKTKSRATFSKISIRGKFNKNQDTFDQPVTLTYDFTPVTEYTYCETVSDDKSRLQADMVMTHPLSNIHSFGIYGRMYDLDGFDVIGPITSLSNTLKTLNLLTAMISISCFLYF